MMYSAETRSALPSSRQTRVTSRSSVSARSVQLTNDTGNVPAVLAEHSMQVVGHHHHDGDPGNRRRASISSCSRRAGVFPLECDALVGAPGQHPEAGRHEAHDHRRALARQASATSQAEWHRSERGSSLSKRTTAMLSVLANKKAPRFLHDARR